MKRKGKAPGRARLARFRNEVKTCVVHGIGAAGNAMGRKWSASVPLRLLRMLACLGHVAEPPAGRLR